MVVHVFLFSDMLLITKPVKRNVENYIVVKPVSQNNECIILRVICVSFVAL